MRAYKKQLDTKSMYSRTKISTREEPVGFIELLKPLFEKQGFKLYAGAEFSTTPHKIIDLNFELRGKQTQFFFSIMLDSEVDDLKILKNNNSEISVRASILAVGTDLDNSMLMGDDEPFADVGASTAKEYVLTPYEVSREIYEVFMAYPWAVPAYLVAKELADAFIAEIRKIGAR